MVRQRPQGGVHAAKDGHPPKPATCANPVKQQYDLGLELGVNGTPAVIGPDGRLLGGYVTPAQLLQELRKERLSRPDNGLARCRRRLMRYCSMS